MNKYARMLPETWVVSIVAFLLLYTALLTDEANRRERKLEARYATSSLVSCEDAVMRGPRGETYKAFSVTLRNKEGELWSAKVKLDHKFGKQCEAEVLARKER